jgi:putative mRNA 3-end processing factor
MIEHQDCLVSATSAGLYCEPGDFFIDPWQPVKRAVVTHAHADHLCRGCESYLIAHDGLSVARARLDLAARIEALAYGEAVELNGVRLSLHPAGHILGSSQVRLEHRGRVWVVSGDYKIDRDSSCRPFESISCDVFISECTFGLPIYRWPSSSDVLTDIMTWWQNNQASGRCSMLFTYSLGKAQRVLVGLAELATEGDGWPGPIFTHGAVETMNDAYRLQGAALPTTTCATQADRGVDWSRALVLAPPSAHNTPWTRRFGPVSTAFASGWMRIRGTRRRRSVDRGFVLSDHVDWPRLLATIDATGAETVWLTHGYTAVVSRWLAEQGREAHAMATRYEGERDEAVR